MHTPRKIDVFYVAGVLFLLVLSLLVQFVVHPPSNPPGAISSQQQNDISVPRSRVDHQSSAVNGGNHVKNRPK